MSAEAAPAGIVTVASALARGRAAGLDRVDRDVLMGALLERDRAWLLIHDDHPLSPEQAVRWSDWCTRRAAGVPVAYLTGRHEFHGLMLQVTPAVLDPRPDTETLVDWALETLERRADDPHLADLRHEPHEALVAGDDGLADLHALIDGAPAHLNPGGWLLLEHGHDQADAVAARFVAAGWREVGHRLDLGGHRRCTGARRP